MIKTAIIKGYVVKRKTGTRIVNCAVDLYKVGEEEPYKVSHTDYKGQFSFEVPAGEYVIMFMGPFFTPVSQRVKIEEDEEKEYKLITDFTGL